MITYLEWKYFYCKFRDKFFLQGILPKISTSLILIKASIQLINTRHITMMRWSDGPAYACFNAGMAKRETCSSRHQQLTPNSIINHGLLIFFMDSASLHPLMRINNKGGRYWGMQIVLLRQSWRQQAVLPGLLAHGFIIKALQNKEGFISWDLKVPAKYS